MAEALAEWDAKNDPEHSGSQDVDAPVKKPRPLVRLKVGLQRQMLPTVAQADG